MSNLVGTQTVGFLTYRLICFSSSSGIGVEATEKGVNGCIVKSLTKSGAIYKDGNIQIGDHIMSINNESMRRITNTQARVILRRASLMGSTDIR